MQCNIRIQQGTIFINVYQKPPSAQRLNIGHLQGRIRLLIVCLLEDQRITITILICDKF